MKLEGSEVVEILLADAWKRINDPAVLKACTPGLESLRAREDGGYDAVLELKLPAITGRFTGSVEYLERSEPERLRMRVRGKGGPGFVDAEATLDLAETDEGTRIHYVADVQVGGQLARLGQRMIAGVTREMASQFFTAFESWRPGGRHRPRRSYRGIRNPRPCWRGWPP